MMISAIIRNTHADWQIEEAANADEAMDRLKGIQPTLAIIDYNMPGLDGLSLCGQIRQQSPDTHITLLTANIQDALRSKAEAMNIGFVGKPITEDKIKSLLTELA
jgi:two-component system chemotaxis response regulator CheY